VTADHEHIFDMASRYCLVCGWTEEYLRDAVDACVVCEHADAHGWWGPNHQGRTHCRGCHGSWSIGTDIQHCVTCHRTFTNVRAADFHRVRGECRDPATVRDRQHRPRLAPSRRHRGPGTTVQIWALAEHRDSRHTLRVPRRSAAEPLGRVPTPANPQTGLTRDSETS
jgi:hypothetical protein